MSLTISSTPQGFSAFITNLGIRDKTDDFVFIKSENLEQLRQIMSKDKVDIHVSLNIGEASATVWGCDLSEGYIEINGKYST